MPNDYIDAVADCIRDVVDDVRAGIIEDPYDTIAKVAELFVERCQDIAGPLFSMNQFLDRCGFSQ